MLCIIVLNGALLNMENKIAAFQCCYTPSISHFFLTFFSSFFPPTKENLEPKKLGSNDVHILNLKKESHP